MPTTTRAASAVRRHAEYYRSLGYQPLPSDPRPESEGGRKKPLVQFADWWESPMPSDPFDSPAAARYGEPNVQVMLGRSWGLCVLDLDGAEAVAHAASWPGLPRTWVSWHTGGGRASRHYWFSTPRAAGPKRVTRLWGVWEPGDGGGKGRWKKHTAVELLCDRSLIMAPPSVHPRTGNRYEFERGHSPKDMTRPAVIPDWLWRMPAHLPPVSSVEDTPPPSPAPPRRNHGPRVRRDEVLLSIPDKVAVARSWGLKFARGGSGGWLYCHDFAREDNNPSCQFHAETGMFWRPDGGKALSLFDLGAETGHYRDWLECMNALADYHGLNT